MQTTLANLVELEYTLKKRGYFWCDECRKEAQRMLNTKRLEDAMPQHKVVAKLNRAAKRWATMSWEEVTRENEYYGLRYPDSQIMEYNGTLPEDYGLKRKKRG